MWYHVDVWLVPEVPLCLGRLEPVQSGTARAPRPAFSRGRHPAHGETHVRYKIIHTHTVYQPNATYAQCERTLGGIFASLRARVRRVSDGWKCPSDRVPREAVAAIFW